LYTAKKRKIRFFDKEIEEIYRKIKVKIGNYEILFSSISDNYDSFILLARSDRVEGKYYIYNKQNDRLELLSQGSPWLKEKDMAKMQPITFKSRDNLTIHEYLTIPLNKEPKNLPVIINPHPGPQWRNSWGFDQFTKFFANRGYAVMQINFRGSTGYGKTFMRAGFKQWGLKMQDDITDGVLCSIEQGIADKDRIGIFGWSRGGYAALAGITFTPELYRCGVDFWGITNYFTLYKSFPSYWKPFLEQINERWGDPVADKDQMYATSPVFHMKKIKAPVFVAQSANDSRVRK
jgi:dipeptidyl aminopeptidase/acylaminoacyl peptidase